MVIALAVGGLYISGAQAVHDTGVFQLDGDAQQSTVPTGEVGGLDDWDSICQAYLASGSAPGIDVCHQAPGVTLPASNSADKSTFITDAFNATSDNIYKGGTDDADISTWLWKQAGPSPNKADLEQAFAAQYTVPTTSTSAEAGHRVLFFGGTRYANNGDTNIGLWFFHNTVGTNGTNTNTDGSCSNSSGCGFTGVHTVGNISLGGSTGAGCNPNPDPTHNVCTPGDIFILSSFTGGGAQPTILAFEWVGAGNATKNYNGSNNCFTNACTLQPLAIPKTTGFTDNRCDGPTVTGDVACAIVNTGEIQSPWLFQDQSTKSPANKIEANELYEGGLDLTGLGFGDACFASMLLDTRSSQSGTSVLQDFALGGFGSCTSSVLTTPKNADGTAAPASSIGTSGSIQVTDSAAITVNGVSSWAGNVSFHLCGPMADSTSNCSTGGTAIGSSKSVSNSSSTALSDPATITSAGRYCWRADFHATSPATGVPDGSDPANGTTLNECFTVGPVSPILSTSPSNGTSAGAASCCSTALDDTISLTGTANEPGTTSGVVTPINPATPGGPAQGTITVRLYGPADTATCTDPSTGVTGNRIAVVTIAVSGDSSATNVYKASTGTLVSGSLTPSGPGHYWWTASYSGDAPNTLPAPKDSNNAATFTTCGDEESFVAQIPTTVITKQSWYPNDTATVGSSVSTDNLAGGTVDFALYNNATCTAGTNNVNILYTERQSITGGANSREVSTHNYAGSTAQTPGGQTVTPFLVNTGYADAAGSVKPSATTKYSWKVVYTPSDQGHTGIQSACTETHSITYTNDNSGGTSTP